MRTLISLAVISLLSGCVVVVSTDDAPSRTYTVWGDSKTGNGVAVTDQRAVAALTGLEVRGGLPVVVQVGSAPSLTVQGDANLVPYIHTEERGGELHVWSEHTLRSTTPLKIVYTTPHLNKVKAGGTTQVEVKGLNGMPLEVRRSGSSRVTLAGNVTHLEARSSGAGLLDATELTSVSVDARLSGSSKARLGTVTGESARFGLSGSSRASASGSVRLLTGQTSGSSSIDLSALTALQADLGASGSSKISAHVKENLQARTSGSSRVLVSGTPQHSTIRGKRVELLN